MSVTCKGVTIHVANTHDHTCYYARSDKLVQALRCAVVPSLIHSETTWAPKQCGT